MWGTGSLALSKSPNQNKNFINWQVMSCLSNIQITHQASWIFLDSIELICDNNTGQHTAGLKFTTSKNTPVIFSKSVCLCLHSQTRAKSRSFSRLLEGAWLYQWQQDSCSSRMCRVSVLVIFSSLSPRRLSEHTVVWHSYSGENCGNWEQLMPSCPQQNYSLNNNISFWTKKCSVFLITMCIMKIFFLHWLSVLFHPSFTCSISNLDFPYSSLFFNSYVFSLHLYCLFTFFHSLPELVSLSNLSRRMRVGKRVCVFCDSVWCSFWSFKVFEAALH